MPIKGKKGKGKSKLKSSPENDDGCIDDPQSSKLVQRMASKTLSSNARKLKSKDDDVDDPPHQAESTSQSSLWLSKAKVCIAYEDCFIQSMVVCFRIPWQLNVHATLNVVSSDLFTQSSHCIHNNEITT